MKRMFRAGVSLLALLLLWASTAAAAERETFVVLPFAVQGPQGYAYLERSLPQMLTSRLYWKGRVEPSVGDLPASQKPVSDEAAAAKALSTYKADYVVWGTVTVLGDTCSLDVRVRNRAGKVWPQAREAKTNQLIAAVRGLSDNINRDVFGRKPEPAPVSSSSRQDSGRVNQMNPDIMINETTPKEVYLNPQFRYAGNKGDDTRLRSQALNFTSIGMEVIDADGDGKNEIFILGDHKLYAFRFTDKLNPIGEIQLPMAVDTLSLRGLPRADGRAWLIVNLVEKDGTPAGAIFTFDGKSFHQEAEKIKYFLNVVKLPPTYRPTLIGQQTSPPTLFRGPVHEMMKSGNALAPSGQIQLPKGANVFNFTFMPANRNEAGSEKIIMLSGDEKLVTFTGKGARLAESPEKFSGSARGMEINPAMPGMGEERVTMRSIYYIPMRMPAVDLDHDGNYELIVNRPISTASDIFDRYRFFPQSEIHCLFWDGVGLNLQWKTRRIKGSMVDYTIADANNDGIMDLVTCLNTHPGAVGVEKRRTIVVLYPLDIGRTDKNTPTSHDVDD